MSRHGRFTEIQERKHLQRYDERRERQRTRRQKMLNEYANARKAADALFKPTHPRFGDKMKEE